MFFITCRAKNEQALDDDLGELGIIIFIFSVYKRATRLSMQSLPTFKIKPCIMVAIGCKPLSSLANNRNIVLRSSLLCCASRSLQPLDSFFKKHIFNYFQQFLLHHTYSFFPNRDSNTLKHTFVLRLKHPQSLLSMWECNLWQSNHVAAQHCSP